MAERACPTCGKSFSSRGITNHMKKCQRGKQQDAISTGPASNQLSNGTPTQNGGQNSRRSLGSSLRKSMNGDDFAQDPRSVMSELKKETTLSQKDTSAAAVAINEFKGDFMKKLNEKCLVFEWGTSTAGSYYDKTKIDAPNEFDLVFFPKNLECNISFEQHRTTIGYCSLKPVTSESVPEFLKTSDGYLSPRNFKSYAFCLFQTIITDPSFPKSRSIKRDESRATECPAFTIKYKRQPGAILDVDLVPVIKMTGWPQMDACRDWAPKWDHKQSIKELRQEYEAVPKFYPGDKHKHLWRLSFTKSSQMLWYHADGGDRHVKTCRKEIFKIFKKLLDDFKQDQANTEDLKLCSHHMRNSFLHAYDKYPTDAEWDARQKRTCLKKAAALLLEQLTHRQLDLYFIKGCNLLQHVPHEEIDRFINFLKDQNERCL